MATKNNFYDVLGVAKTANADEIKKAYRKQALEWHPDRHKDNKDEAERKFKEINEAYQVLSDPQKKSAYDQFGHEAFAPGGGFRGSGGFGGNGSPFGQTGSWGPFTYTYTTSGGGTSPFGDFGDPFDIFEQFFGGTSPFGRVQRKPRYSMILEFMEAAKGVEKEVTIEGKKRKIKIPPGIDEGQRIDFGDFTLSVNIKPHKVFQREGADVYISASIPYSFAVLGGEIDVATVEEDIKIRIRPGTQPGTMVRLRGKGLKHLHGGGFGDEYIRLNIPIPEKLTREQKILVEELRESGL